MTKNFSKYNTEDTQFEENERTQFGGSERTQFGDSEHTQFDNNERTQFSDSERTQFGDSEQTPIDHNLNNRQAASGKPGTQPKKKKSMGKRVAVGAASGIALGAVWGVLSSATPTDQQADNASQASDGDTQQQDVSSADVPEWSDGQVSVAQGVSDDMSFTDAFDTARMEVGPGGVFEWHGYIYSTYTEEEWNNMSQAERDEYGAHFNWTGATPGDDDVEVVDAQHQGGASAHHGTASAHTAAQQHGEGPDYADGSDPSDGPSGNVVPASTHDDDDVEVEILGVHHDDDSGYTYANILLDDHQAVLVDINDDDTFDVLAVDANDDGQLQENEMMDISAHGLTAQQLNIDTHHTDSQATQASQEGVCDATDHFPGADDNVTDCNNMDTNMDMNGDDVYSL